MPRAASLAPPGRARRRRRAHISAYVDVRTAEDLDDAADHHSISLSELVGRVLHAAASKGFPTDTMALRELYPLID